MVAGCEVNIFCNSIFCSNVLLGGFVGTARLSWSPCSGLTTATFMYTAFGIAYTDTLSTNSGRRSLFAANGDTIYMEVTKRSNGVTFEVSTVYSHGNYIPFKLSYCVYIV